jgi:hypothetical protein
VAAVKFFNVQKIKNPIYKKVYWDCEPGEGLTSKNDRGEAGPIYTAVFD